MGALTLRDAIAILETRYGAPPAPPTTDPFELILWENVAYLTSAARRAEAFAALKAEVGTSPAAILAAAPQSLERITRRGILKAASAVKLRDCARIAVEEFDGDLAPTIDGPVDEAIRALRLFPGIGRPGAEKILLFSGRLATIAPESNGLRVLVRLGFVTPHASYARMYAGAARASAELPKKTTLHQAAHLLLQRHGQTTCTRTLPKCPQCPLEPRCAFAAASPRVGGGR